MYLFRGGDAQNMQKSPEVWQAHMQRWMMWMQTLAEQGKFDGAAPLATVGKIVTGKGKKIIDGPYAEAKEVVGGYVIVNAINLDEAVELSKGCPLLEFDDGVIEVREVQQLNMQQ